MPIHISAAKDYFFSSKLTKTKAALKEFKTFIRENSTCDAE
jgi:hypothetical protein